ncbi:MAG: NAD(P)/FAD-dependent oxidoreductase [Haloechinothrix sp.]
MKHIAVVGASLAAAHAIEGLRERGYKHDITLVGAERRLPYTRPPLSKESLAGTQDHESLALHPGEWYDEQGVRLMLGSPAVSLDAGARRLVTGDGGTVDYDGLVIATGSRARTLVLPGSAEPIRTLRTIDDSLRLHENMIPGQHLTVIGAGFVGLEVAATVRQLGLEVTVVEVERAPLTRVFGQAVGSWFRRLHERNGVQMRCGSHLDSLDRTDDAMTLCFRGGERIRTDHVIAGVGAVPAVEWLEGSGVEVTNGVACHPDLRTSVPDVVAAGDVARWRNPLFDEEMRVEHWTNAVEQGRHAAGTLLGDRTPFESVPYFWTDQFDAKVRFVGRARSGDDVIIEREDESSLVARYGRAGLLRGAVCVGSPRLLAKYRAAIAAGTRWEDCRQTGPPTPSPGDLQHHLTF